MQKEWTFNDFSEKFYVYLARMGASDALYKLKSIQPNTIPCKKILEEFLSNMKNVLEAATVPFFVSILSASTSQQRLIEDLLSNAKDGNLESLAVANFLLKGNSFSQGIKSVIPSFKILSEADILNHQFDTLYKLIAIRFYGCLEEISRETLKIIITKDINFLDCLSSEGIDIGKSPCSKLKARIIQDQRELLLTLDQAYDEHILNKSYSFEQYNKIFSLIGVSCSTTTQTNLKLLESSRHLFVHKNSKIDIKFINETSGAYAVNDTLRVHPKLMYQWQESIIDYSSNMISSLDKYLS